MRRLALEENDNALNSRFTHLFLNSRYSMKDLIYEDDYENYSNGNIEKLGITDAELE